MMARRKALEDPRAAAKERVAEVLARFEASVKEAGVRLTRSMIAEDTQVAGSAVSAWFAGKQLPRPKQLEALAGVFSLNNDLRRMEYRKQLFDAAGIPLDLSGAREPLARARERSGAISIGVVAYDEVGIDQFFEDVVRAFGDFCGFLVNVKRVSFANLADAIANGDVDIGAGLWETPDRLLTLRYIGMPLEMGMNALTFAKAKEALPLRNGFYDVDAIEPIMNEGQATYRFAQHVLGIPKHRIVSCDYNVDAFASRLLRSFEDWQDARRPLIPVLVSDEAMCLKVHNRLLSDMVASSPKLLERMGLPLILMDGRRDPDGLLADPSNAADPYKPGCTQWGKAGNLIAAHPRYNISLCVKRAERDEWFSYVEDAWRIFIRGNREFLISKYTDLCLNLSVLVREAREVLERAAELAGLPEPSQLAGELGARWQAVVRDWLFDNELRDFHDEQTWKNILKHVKEEDLFPKELREKGAYDKD